MEHPVRSPRLLGVLTNLRGIFAELAAEFTSTEHMSAPPCYPIVTLTIPTP